MPDIREVMTRKVGPFPVWTWTLMASGVAAAFMIMGKNKQVATDQSGGAGGPDGKFESSQSSTKTDAQGNTTTSNYSASGNSFAGIPGYLSSYGFPMPYSLGDIYNNIATTVQQPPANTVINIPSPPRHHYPHPPPETQTEPPPSPPPGPAHFPDPGSVYQVDPGDSLWKIAKYTLQSRGQSTSNVDIDRYWKQIYANNRGIIGDNPNLIHPNQVFVLP